MEQLTAVLQSSDGQCAIANYLLRINERQAKLWIRNAYIFSKLKHDMTRIKDENSDKEKPFNPDNIKLINIDNEDSEEEEKSRELLPTMSSQQLPLMPSQKSSPMPHLQLPTSMSSQNASSMSDDEEDPVVRRQTDSTNVFQNGQTKSKSI